MIGKSEERLSQNGSMVIAVTAFVAEILWTMLYCGVALVGSGLFGGMYLGCVRWKSYRGYLAIAAIEMKTQRQSKSFHSHWHFHLRLVSAPICAHPR